MGYSPPYISTIFILRGSTIFSSIVKYIYIYMHMLTPFFKLSSEINLNYYTMMFNWLNTMM